MVAFVWDEEKARANLRKHGVSFDEARSAFGDPFALEFADDRFDYSEDRFVLIAMAGPRLLTVVHVEHDDVYRLISAWPSTRAERNAYFDAQT